MTTIYLVRHGVTSHTATKLSGRLPGVNLSADGRNEAEAVSATLAGVKFRAIYSSPIERTLQTAEIIAVPHGLDVQVIEDLAEVRYGRWTNRSYKALARTKLWERVQRWPSTARFPDGESLTEVQVRATAALERLSGAHPKAQICCVSHADVIRLVMAHYLGVHIDLFQRLVIGPASISVVMLGNEGPRVLAMNVPPHTNSNRSKREGQA